MLYILIAASVLLSILLYFYLQKPASAPTEPSAPPSSTPPKSQPKPSSKSKPSKPKAAFNPVSKHHIDSYKNLQTAIIDFDIKPNYFALCCEDSSIRIYKITSITDTKAKYVHGLLSKNQPTALTLSTDGSKVFVGGSQDLQIHPFKVQHSAHKFSLEPEKPFIQKHTLRISSLAYTPNCLVSCGEEQDTTIYVWTHSGEILTTFENKQLKHKFLVLSKDFRFFSIATWLGSARVFEFMKAKKTENYDGIHVVMELGGHSQGLSCLNFAVEGGLAVTCGLDCQVRLWNINVQYEYKEHAVLLKAIKIDQKNGAPEYCALTSKRLVLAIGNGLWIYSVPDLEIVSVIEDAHPHNVTKIDIVENVLVSCSKDTRLMLWQLD